MSLVRELTSAWPWVMAWRDARHSWLRLAASAATIALGVGVLVAVSSLSAEVSEAVRSESKGLLGADLAIRGRAAWSPEAEAMLAEIASGPGREIARQISFTTVASFPKSGAVRQARVRALEGAFPWYGEIETAPPTALEEFRAGRGALIDESLIDFGGSALGDPVRIGTVDVPIVGALLRIPGETATNALFGARVYVPLASVDPQLLERGSRVEYSALIKLAPGENAETWRDRLATFLRDQDLRAETARGAEASWSRASDRLHDYLHLAALAALLLGGIGVGSAMHLHARRKREIVATLRCLGAVADRAFSVFAAQALLIGLAGTVAGAVAGVAAHRLLPRLFADFLPVTIEGRVSASGLLGGCVVGIGFALLAALWPLSRLKHVPPVDALRSSTAEGSGDGARNETRGAIGYVVALFGTVAAFGVYETGRVRDSIAYAAALLAGCVVLVGVGVVLVHVARAAARRSLPFAWRYAIANLQRPDNQTPALLLTLGLGAFLLATIDQTEAQLFATIDRASSGIRPNLVLFDVQPDDAADIRKIFDEHHAPILDDVPVTTMRIARVRDRTVVDLRNDRESRISSWALGREYRSTYRDHLTESEQTVGGVFPPPVTGADPSAVSGTEAASGAPSPADALPAVSLEDDIARQLGITVGDSITWDVQGVQIATRVTHLRKVEWQRLSLNFFALFPPGVIDDAPQFRILTTRVDDKAALAALQRAIAQRHPGISAVDVGMILEIADTLLSRIGLVLRAMGLICVTSGGLVLLGAWLGTRRERMIESALLRALGATRAFVRQIATIEAAALGFVAAVAGSSLGVAATWALARWKFDIPFELAWKRVLVLGAGVAVFGVLIAAFAGRGIHRTPPLDVLRDE